MSSSHVTTSLAQGTLVAGKYRLQRLLGEGAMGVVWSARNELTSGQVALKLILGPGPELRLRLLREAQACCQITHKNVIQIHDVGQMESGDPFLVMELLSGETLAELLARKRRLNQREAAVIGRDVARALSAAHEKGIVHRDLKPANIFLHNQPGEDARVVKVLDFGVSKNLLAADGLQTMMGGAIGSPSYMSPEQARGARDIDARADTWSLGVLLFEMLTGERPFLGEAREVIDCILEGDIPLVSRRVRSIDPALERLISGCLTRDRELRTWPIAEVAMGLEPFTEGLPRSTTPTLTALWGVVPPLMPPPPPSSRPRAPVVAPVVVPRQESESDAETQKLEADKLATLATPAPRPVLRAELAAPVPYDPTVRMFSAAALPAVLQDPRVVAPVVAATPDLPPPAAAIKPPALPVLPPPLPRPPPLPLTPREAAPTEPHVVHAPEKPGDLLAARIFVGGVVAAVVLLLAFTHRPSRSGAVSPAAPEAATPVTATSEPAPAPAPAPAGTVEVQAPTGAVVNEVAAAPQSTLPVEPPKREVAARPRPRAANPHPLPRCGRFVKTGCTP
jgi:serine/threonine-protein kinase